MEQSNLAKPVLPTGPTTLAKASGAKIYDIPHPVSNQGSGVPSKPVLPNPIVAPNIQSTNSTTQPATVSPLQLSQVPSQQSQPNSIAQQDPMGSNQMMQTNNQNSNPIPQNVNPQPPQQIRQDNMQNSPNTNFQQSAQIESSTLGTPITQLPADQPNPVYPEDQFLDEAMQDPNAPPGYIDPVVLQQRIQAQRRDFENQTNTTRPIDQLTSPKPLTNDSLKYLVGMAVVSVIIYLIMRIL